MKSDPDAWFAAKGQNTDEEPATLDEASSLKNYLHGTTSLHAAARCLMITNESVRSLSDKVDRVSWLLFDAAIEFEPRQVAILDLVEMIHSLSDDDIPLSQEQKDRFSGWESWKRLQRFEDLLDEMRRSYWAYRALPDEDDDDPYECCRRWTNLNAFLARRFLYYQEPFLLLMIGISTVKTALEQEPPTQDKEDAGRASTFEADVSAAAQWLLLTAPKIFSCVDNDEKATLLEPALTPLSLWRDGESLSIKRWNFWKSRLDWIRQQDSLARETLELAAEAREAMNRIEGTKKHQ